MKDSTIMRIVQGLEKEVPSLTAANLDDAVGFHTEVIQMGDDWQFLGVYETLEQGVRKAIEVGGKQFQCNYVPKGIEGLPQGFYLYHSREDP